MSVLYVLVVIFVVYIVYTFVIVANQPSIEQFNEEKPRSNDKLLTRIESLESDIKELSALLGYTLESIDTRVKKNEEKLKKLTLRQRDTQAEIKDIQN